MDVLDNMTALSIALAAQIFVLVGLFYCFRKLSLAEKAFVSLMKQWEKGEDPFHQKVKQLHVEMRDVHQRLDILERLATWSFSPKGVLGKALWTAAFFFKGHSYQASR
jgi:hypothetical protein